MNGGKAIDAGAYGCVFSPQLPCEDKKTRKKGISKLMLARYATDEAKKMASVRKNLSLVPSIRDFTVLDDIRTCRPGDLTSSDFRNFNKLCAYPLERTYKSANAFNKEKEKYLLLQMPDAGKPLSIFIKSICQMNESDIIIIFKQLNRELIALLLNAIIPMIGIKRIHMDVKPENLLVSGSDVRRNIKIKLIDWGLSIDISSQKELYVYKPFQFNLPLGCILASREATNLVNRLLRTGKTFPEIATAALDASLATNQGHYELIYRTISLLFPLTNPKAVIRNNIAAILKACSSRKDGHLYFESRRYLREVFYKNVDIIGLLSVYQEISLHCSKPYRLIANIKELVWKYMYSSKYAAKAIWPDSLHRELQALSYIIGGRKKSKRICKEEVVDLKPGPKFKKYTATVKNRLNGKTRVVHFGDNRFEQYKDSGTGLHTRLNHGDKTRRKNYFTRHSGVPDKETAIELELKKSKGMMNAKLLSHYYLW